MSLNIDKSQWRLETDEGIKYKLVSRSGGYGIENGTGSEVMVIEATDLENLAKEIFPTSFYSGGYLYYPDPRRMPGQNTLIAKNMAWKGFTEGRPIDPFSVDSSAPDKTYEEYLEVTISYGTSPQNDTESDSSDPLTFLEITSNASGEFLVTPIGGGATWDDGSEVTRDDVPNTVTQSLVEWTARWPQIPYDFFNNTIIARLRSKLGKVNSEAMYVFNNAPAETILFVGYTKTDHFTWREGQTGRAPVSLDLKFVEKNFQSSLPVSGGIVTHQHTYRPGTPAIRAIPGSPGRPRVEAGWHRLLLNDNRLYATTNLSQIFA